MAPPSKSSSTRNRPWSLTVRKTVGRPHPLARDYRLSDREMARLDRFLEARDGPQWRSRLWWL